MCFEWRTIAFTAVAIKVGIANPTMIEVLSGLNEGDVVALPGDVALKENLRIVAVRPE